MNSGSGPQADVELFRSLETALHGRDVRSSPDSIVALLADDFVEFGTSGHVCDRAEAVGWLTTERSDPGYVVDEFAARALAPDVTLVTYRTTRIDPETNTAVRSLRSSIWKHTDGRWRLVFHQGTRIPSASTI